MKSLLWGFYFPALYDFSEASEFFFYIWSTVLDSDVYLCLSPAIAASMTCPAKGWYTHTHVSNTFLGFIRNTWSPDQDMCWREKISPKFTNIIHKVPRDNEIFSNRLNLFTSIKDHCLEHILCTANKGIGHTFQKLS